MKVAVYPTPRGSYNVILTHHSDIGRVRSDIPHTAPCPLDISDNGASASDISDSGDSPSDIPYSGDCGMHNSHRSAPASDISDSGDSPSDIPYSASFPPHNSHIATQPSDTSYRPGDDFNRRGDVRAILAQAGWALAKPGENEYWRRPGKSSGWSASLKDGVLYVFSANAALTLLEPIRKLMEAA